MGHLALQFAHPSAGEGRPGSPGDYILVLPWHGCASFPVPKPRSTTHCCRLHLALLYSDQPARVTESCQVPLRSLFYAPFQHVFKGLSLSCVIGRVLGLTLSNLGSLILLSQGREMIISSQATSRGSCDGQTQKYVFTCLKNPKPENKCEVLLMFFSSEGSRIYHPKMCH